MKSLLEYVRDNGHEARFGALLCLWQQAIPHVSVDAHADMLTLKFNSYMQNFNRQIHLQSGYDICALFVESEQSHIYGMLGTARTGAI